LTAVSFRFLAQGWPLRSAKTLLVDQNCVGVIDLRVGCSGSGWSWSTVVTMSALLEFTEVCSRLA
jgi:hypothetical protein